MSIAVVSLLCIILLQLTAFYIEPIRSQHITVTPIIGAKCDVGSPEVPIGGKQTQFFLKCERSSQSEDGKGVWIVRSRSASLLQTPLSTSSSAPQTESSIQQQPQKSANNICVQDRSAKDGDSCSVSAVCLQQDQEQAMQFLQCEQSTFKWRRKSCPDGQTFSFEHQACVSQIRQNTLTNQQNPPISAASDGTNSGVLCTYTQCSHENPCQQGTCNNGYCCTSTNTPQYSPPQSTNQAFPVNAMVRQQSVVQHSYRPLLAHQPIQPSILQQQQQPFHSPVLQQPIQTALMQQPLLSVVGQQGYPILNQLQSPYSQALASAFIGICIGGGAPAGACLNSRCARGYTCSPGNICCPTSQTTPGLPQSSTVNPMKNPFVCVDGTQAAGACIMGQCGGNFKCIGGLCCNKTGSTPRCLDGSVAVGACLYGHCGAKFICTTGNLCCPSTTLTGVCPNGGTSIGTCVNNLCPTGYTCVANQCCPGSGTSAFRCSDPSKSIGPCVGDACPDDGFQCDTSMNLCCPLSESVGPCVDGNLCPAGYTCFKEATTPSCFKECNGRGTKVGEPNSEGKCQDGATKIFGVCCMVTRFHTSRLSSYIYDRHPDWVPGSTFERGVGMCPDGSGAASSCWNGICGPEYDCFNNLCCAASTSGLSMYTNLALRPIGSPCDFSQQCMSYADGLSICDMGVCRCVPPSYNHGFACIRRLSAFYDALDDATNRTDSR